MPLVIGGSWYAANHIPWFGAWLADTLRSVIGTENVASLEETAYDLEDRWNRFWRAGEKPKQYWDAPSGSFRPRARRGLESPARRNRDRLPPRLPPAPRARPMPRPPPAQPPSPRPKSALSSPRTPPPATASGCQSRCPKLRPRRPILYKTLLHPDAKRPWAELFVVAIDLTRVQLFSVPGTNEPRGTAPGARELARPGLIPEPQRPNLVAGFNGGFKEEHGHYGMKIGGVLLVAPRKDGCTVASMNDGSLRIASWKAFESIADTAVWWRQTPACLAENGKLHPALYDENTNWGAAIGGGTVVRRSAAGLDPDRKVLYMAVANSVSPRTLAIGMQHTGASDIAQLDINYSYPRFVLFPKAPSGERESASLFEGFKVDKDDYLRTPSPRDFFYLARRKPGP